MRNRSMLTSADYDKLIELAGREGTESELVAKLQAEKVRHYATDDEVDAIVDRVILRDAAILDALAR